MSNLVKHAAAQIRQIVLNAFGAAVGEGVLPAVPLSDFKTEFPPHSPQGAMRCDAAVRNAEALQCRPQELAEILRRFLVFDEDYSAHCHTDEKGILWFSLSSQWYTGVLQDILACQSAYGRSLYGRGKKLLIEAGCGLACVSLFTVLRPVLTAQVLSEVSARNGYWVFRRWGWMPESEEALVSQVKLAERLGFEPQKEPLAERFCGEVLELFQKRGLTRLNEGDWLYENGEDRCLLQKEGRPTRFLWDLASCYEAVAGQGYEEILRVCSGCREEDARILERAVRAMFPGGASLRVCLVSPVSGVEQEDFSEAVRLLCCDTPPQQEVFLLPEKLEQSSALVLQARALLEKCRAETPVQEAPWLWESQSPQETQLVCQLALFSNCLLGVLSSNNPALLTEYLRELLEIAQGMERNPLFAQCVAVTLDVALQILGLGE